MGYPHGSRRLWGTLSLKGASVDVFFIEYKSKQKGGVSDMWTGVVIAIVIVVFLIVGVIIEKSRDDEPGHSPWG